MPPDPTALFWLSMTLDTARNSCLLAYPSLLVAWPLFLMSLRRSPAHTTSLYSLVKSSSSVFPWLVTRSGLAVFGISGRFWKNFEGCFWAVFLIHCFIFMGRFVGEAVRGIVVIKYVNWD